jgi:hypothetical protein
MLIVIDFGDDDESLVNAEEEKASQEAAVAIEEQRKREAYFEWVRHHEQVAPQVVPVTGP